MTPDERPGRPESSSLRRGQGSEGGWDALIAALEAERITVAAEAYSHGRRCLHLVHGDVESAEDEAALQAVADDLSGLPERLGGDSSQWVRTTGTNDTRTWWWISNADLDAQTIVEHARTVVAAHARPWWRLYEEPL